MIQPITIIKILLVITVLVLIAYTIIAKRCSKLQKQNAEHMATIIKLSKEKREGLLSIENLKNYNNSLINENTSFRMLLRSIVNEPLKVFTNSNFYANFSIYKGKYYAKVNNNKTNNKKEAIPILTLIDSKYKVVDLYKLKELLKQPDLPTIDAIRNSTVMKEELIKTSK